MPLFGKKKMFGKEDLERKKEEDSQFEKKTAYERGLFTNEGNVEYLNRLAKTVEKKFEIKEEDLRGKQLIKEAVELSIGKKWDLGRTFLALKYINDGKVKESGPEMMERAEKNNMELADVVMLEMADPEVRIKSLDDAKRYGTNVVDTVEFNANNPKIDENLKRRIFEQAGKSKQNPNELLEWLMKKARKKGII